MGGLPGLEAYPWSNRGWQPTAGVAPDRVEGPSLGLFEREPSGRTRLLCSSPFDESFGVEGDEACTPPRRSREAVLLVAELDRPCKVVLIGRHLARPHGRLLSSLRQRGGGALGMGSSLPKGYPLVAVLVSALLPAVGSPAQARHTMSRHRGGSAKGL